MLAPMIHLSNLSRAEIVHAFYWLRKDDMRRMRRMRNFRAREKHQALKDLGLTRVRGALGGVYYE